MKMLLLAGILALSASAAHAAETASPYAADCAAYAQMEGDTAEEREQFYHDCVVELTRLEVEGDSRAALSANHYRH